MEISRPGSRRSLFGILIEAQIFTLNELVIPMSCRTGAPVSGRDDSTVWPCGQFNTDPLVRRFGRNPPSMLVISRFCLTGAVAELL